jgi:glycosyltransferase involved in cell wall biosynthesis
MVEPSRNMGTDPHEQVAPVHLTWDGRVGSSEEEGQSGERSYLDCLADIHRMLRPDRYLEIGIRHGKSLSLAQCEAVGVDPDPDVKFPLGDRTRVVAATSDGFFSTVTTGPFDLIFIDGMHLIEYVLRDFINSEKLASDRSAILIDDVCPNHASQAARSRHTQVWTGDVWKILPILRKWRPELSLHLVDASPTGLLLVTGLNPRSTVLHESMGEILSEFGAEQAPPRSVLDRTGAASPWTRSIERELDGIVNSRPRLSVVVVSYEMDRELPRTIRSLSPAVQKGIAADEYEVILVDNGSKQPVNRKALQSILPGLAVHSVANAEPSPCRAVNIGLQMARGDLVGVMIDGARMASPGLLRGALEASKLGERAVVGTYAFHLGSKVQMRSVLEGYGPAEEDALLAASGWEKDGYRLFDISVFAASSATGWFSLPNETNALFMRAHLWEEIGGYDERFRAPGGGLVNLDVWKRLCEDPSAQIVMLLGEGTFHQVHGGVATNNKDHEATVASFRAEYLGIRGKEFSPPIANAMFLGMGPLPNVTHYSAKVPRKRRWWLIGRSPDSIR